MQRLGEISLAMNEQGITLDESLRLYGEAVVLIRSCKDDIVRAKQEIQRLEGNHE